MLIKRGCVIGLAACMLALACGQAASASLSRSAFRAQRLCSAPPSPGTAHCLGMRLISKSLTSADLHANAVKQAAEAASGAAPAVLNKTVPGGFTPAGLHTAYSLPTETPASATQTIAVVDAYNDPTVESDLAVYDKQFGLPTCTTANGCFRRLNQSGKTSPLPAKSGEWSSEISLDVQMAHAICQNCHILLVEATNQNWASFGAAVNAAVNAGATEISNSYGGPEFSSYSTIASYYDHPGVVVTVSSGDCGYFNQACSGWTEAANFPADSPDVVAVGGTSLSGSGESWGSSDWNDGGSGCSAVFNAQLWQSAASNFSATGCASGRSVADVSAVGDPYTGVDVYDTTPAANGDNTGWGVWGGTSASSPIVAAEFALAGGARGVEFPAATLYAHLGESGALYDVSFGSNGSCSGATACNTHSGYDGPTGVGSPVGLSAFGPAGSPVNSSAPTVSGTAEIGQTLTAAAGTWSAGPTSTTYQWQICNASGALCSAVSGATANTFAVPPNALHLTIRVVVGAANGSGAGTSTASSATSAVVSNVPSITSISPSSGATGSKVTITGTALNGATMVKFGTLTATFTVLSPTQIEATVPNGVVSSTISITTPVKAATSTAKFTPTLSVSAVTPGRAAAGATITLKGIGFTNTSAVSFTGGAAATSVTYVSATTLRAVVPVGARTGVITVTNSAAPIGATSTAFTFTFA